MLTKLKEVGIKLTGFGIGAMVFSYVQLAIVHWLRLTAMKSSSLGLFNNLFIIGGFSLIVGVMLLILRIVLKWIDRLTTKH